VLVNLEPLRALLVLFELFLPFILADRGQNTVWLPAHHRQSTFAQPRVATDPHDSEHRGAHGGEPGPNESLLACDDEFLILDVENDRIEAVVESWARCLCRERPSSQSRQLARCVVQKGLKHLLN